MSITTQNKRSVEEQHSFSQRLLNWFNDHGRHDLPWQHPRTPYRVWLSEIMLQQTQVVTVIPYFERFIARFPDLGALAASSVDEVLSLWSGLGYYTRGRNLHKAAQQVVAAGLDDLPEDFDFLLNLAGIGRSTAGAIMAQAFGRPYPILDGNVRRVLCRYHQIEGWPGRSKVEKQLWRLAQQHTPKRRVVDYTQAIMDFGATICQGRNPDCKQCPLQNDCCAYQHGVVSQYPQRRPKKQVPLKKTNLLLLTNHEGEVLLQKRPPTGIWGGLWSFPEWDGAVDLEKIIMEDYGLQTISVEKMVSFIHTFTHFRLEITPLRLYVERANSTKVMEPERTLWYKFDPSNSLAMPVPVIKLLQAINQ